MKIRTQFLLTMFLFGLVLTGTAVSVAITNQQVNRLTQQSATAHQIEQDARDLSHLSNDYLLFGESQQRARWESKFAALSEQISRITPDTPEQEALTGNIRGNQTRLKAIFDNAVSNLESPTYTPDAASNLAFIRVSSSRMEVLEQGIIFDASQIYQMFTDQMDKVQQTNEIIIFVILVIFGAYFIANYGLIYRHTLRSITALEEGTKIIGLGNLEFAIPEGRTDEIGALARAFNRMTANLKEVTASKADLEREITERKRIEQEREQLLTQVQAQAEALQNANKELQEFAFVASHDLQEPLRKIIGFSRLIGNNSTLDEAERDYLVRMQKAAQRMQKMINDLLELSRITTHQKPYERVDLNQVAATVVDDLEGRIQQSQGQVVLNPLPFLEADPIQMHQLLQNLIGNALKFHRADSPPVVQAGYREHSPGKVEIYVQDNGIGFDMAFLNQIFLPFKRLHGRGEYEGSGIGLAVCQKIAERHGGWVTAQSAPGEGATFSVVLPVKQGLG